MFISAAGAAVGGEKEGQIELLPSIIWKHSIVSQDQDPGLGMGLSAVTGVKDECVDVSHPMLPPPTAGIRTRTMQVASLVWVLIWHVPPNQIGRPAIAIGSGRISIRYAVGAGSWRQDLLQPPASSASSPTRR